MRFDRTFWLLLGAALILALPLALAETIPLRDLAGRYAPMAEALAAGDWEHGFHSAYPPLQPLLAAGVIRLFGGNGFAANQVISLLFYLGSAFPLFWIFRELWGRRTALWSLAMYLAADQLLSLAVSGIRDSGRTFFLALAVAGLLSLMRRRNLAGALVVALGAAGLTLLRGDTFLIALLAGTGCLYLDLYGSDRRWHFPRYALAAGGVFLLLILPWLIHQQRVTGYPLPEWRHGAMMNRIWPSLPPVANPGEYQRTPARLPDLPPAARKVPAAAEHPPFSEFVAGVLEGLYLPYLALVALGVYLRWKRREWSAGETLVLAVVGLHLLAVAAQIRISSRFFYMSSRYLLPASPLLFGWAALGLEWLRELGSRTPRGRKLVTAGLIALGLLLYLSAWRRTTDFNKSKVLERNRGRKLTAAAAARGPAGAVLTNDTRLGYLSGRTFWVLSHARGVAVTEFCRLNGVSQLVLTVRGEEALIEQLRRDRNWQEQEITPDYLIFRRSE